MIWVIAGPLEFALLADDSALAALDGLHHPGAAGSFGDWKGRGPWESGADRRGPPIERRGDWRARLAPDRCDGGQVGFGRPTRHRGPRWRRPSSVSPAARRAAWLTSWPASRPDRREDRSTYALGTLTAPGAMYRAASLSLIGIPHAARRRGRPVRSPTPRANGSRLGSSVTLGSARGSVLGEQVVVGRAGVEDLIVNPDPEQGGSAARDLGRFRRAKRADHVAGLVDRVRLRATRPTMKMLRGSRRRYMWRSRRPDRADGYHYRRSVRRCERPGAPLRSGSGSRSLPWTRNIMSPSTQRSFAWFPTWSRNHRPFPIVLDLVLAASQVPACHGSGNDNGSWERIRGSERLNSPVFRRFLAGR